ncbi:MAG: UDP-N-acetylmuramate dehydrogenase [Acetatifactor sp.]|nr:UDP-N-acetylmuramate dehydrogenase [Acetatifactor sp.]
MISDTVAMALETIVPKENIHKNEPMSAHTTFRVGGPADCLIEVESAEQLVKLRQYFQKLEMPHFILGNGSNVLVSDLGYEGVILQIGRKMSEIRVDGCTVTAQAGALLSQVAHVALEHGLTGMEFASGIPGTVGGAAVMNAGAYDGDMSGIINRVQVVADSGEILELDNETMEFGYRNSIIRHQPFVVTEVEYTLRAGDKDKIKTRMDELAKLRREKQPLEYPSAGSTFKRPEGYFAGKLIMDAALRGFQVGGAKVSDKHCGFVINAGNATAADILGLIRTIQAKVQEQFQVSLETEVVMLGKFER